MRVLLVLFFCFAKVAVAQYTKNLDTVTIKEYSNDFIIKKINEVKKILKKRTNSRGNYKISYKTQFDNLLVSQIDSNYILENGELLEKKFDRKIFIAKQFEEFEIRDSQFFEKRLRYIKKLYNFKFFNHFNYTIKVEDSLIHIHYYFEQNNEMGTLTINAKTNYPIRFFIKTINRKSYSITTVKYNTSTKGNYNVANSYFIASDNLEIMFMNDGVNLFINRIEVETKINDYKIVKSKRNKSETEPSFNSKIGEIQSYSLIQRQK